MKTRAVWAMTSLLLAVGISFADDGLAATGRLVGKIDYWYVGHLEQLDDEGRLLVWEGTIDGDVTGKVKYWFVLPPPVPGGTFTGGEVAFYVARWEVRADNELLLAGESAGKTVYPDGEDGMWDGHGIVTDASPEFNALKGRKVYETGPVILGSDPPVSFSGTGMFQVY